MKWRFAGWRTIDRSEVKSVACDRGRRRVAVKRPIGLEPLEARLLLSHQPFEHIHPVLDIVIDGTEVVIPANVGLTPTRHYSPHTHDTTGVLHIGEGPLAGIDPPGSPVRFTILDDFFDVWRTTNVGLETNNPNAFFSRTQILEHVADASHFVRLTVNGVPNTEFELYSPHDGDQVVISFENVRNQAPTADAQNVDVLLGTPRSITLTGDDNDPDVVQALSFRVQTLPTDGTLRDSNGEAVNVGVDLPSPNLTYTPNPDFAGNDSFTFVAVDDGGTADGGQDTSDPATVSIVVSANRAPVANDQTVRRRPETPQLVTLTGDDADADIEQALAFRVETLPANGILRDSNGAVVTLGVPLPTANLTYEANTGFHGTDQFTFVTMDDGGTAGGGQDTSQPATVTLDWSVTTIEDVQLVVGSAGITAVDLSFSKLMNSTLAGDPNNYGDMIGSGTRQRHGLRAIGKDTRPGTRDDKAIAFATPSHSIVVSSADNSSHSLVRLTFTKAIKLGTFFQIVVAASLTDVLGNALDGNADGTAGDNYSLIIGRGTKLSYSDSGLDKATLNLTGGGSMELTLAANGDGQQLRLIGISINSTLSGTIKKPKRSGNGMTTLASLTPTTGFRNNLPTSFQIGGGSVLANVVDRLLSSMSDDEDLTDR